MCTFLQNYWQAQRSVRHLNWAAKHTNASSILFNELLHLKSWLGSMGCEIYRSYCPIDLNSKILEMTFLKEKTGGETQPQLEGYLLFLM